MKIYFHIHTVTSQHMQAYPNVEKVEPVQKKISFSGLSWKYTTGTILNWIIGIGIFVRVFHFVYNRSFWTDEVYLNVNLIRMSFLELLGPLEYEQKAPIGYLWAVKVCVLLFGKQEMALRLFSLLCGMASLLVFKKVLSYFFSSSGVLMGMAILALSPPLVYYAVEAKQYSTDLVATILAIYLYIRYSEKNSTVSLWLWGIWGALLIWFSYPAIFILAGMAIGVSLYNLANKKWKPLFYTLLPFTLWLISFAIHYFLFIQKQTDSEWLVDWFKDIKSFMPLPPTSAKELGWFITMPLSMLHFAVGLSWFDLNYTYSNAIRGIARMPLLPLLCWLLGLVMVYRQNKKLFLVLIFPFLLAMLASGLEKYPLFERLFIFLAPLLILFIVSGYEQIMAWLPANKWKYMVPILLLIGAVGNSVDTLARPSMFGKHFKNATGRQALLYINNHMQAQDAVYVYWNFNHFYRYYKESYPLTYNAIEGSDLKLVSNNADHYLQNLRTDFAAFESHERVWFVYRKFGKQAIGDFRGKPEWYHQEEFHPGKTIQDHLASAGKLIEVYETPDMCVALIDLKNKANTGF